MLLTAEQMALAVYLLVRIQDYPYPVCIFAAIPTFIRIIFRGILQSLQASSEAVL
jgi:hypothetical protein